jgi:uncharacterized membrane protein YccC
MSDVVAVALITGSGTLIGASVGAVVTYLTAKRNAETAVHNANRQADVELEKVQAEAKRQLNQYREDERRNRQGTYHRLLAAFDTLDWWARNPRGLGKHYQSIVSEIQLLAGGCSIFGDEAVRDALRPIMDLLADVESEPQEPSDEGQDRRRRGYRERRDELIEAQNTLAAAMRTDVTSIHD